LQQTLRLHLGVAQLPTFFELTKMDIFLYTAVNQSLEKREPGITTGEILGFKGLLKMSQFFGSEGIDMPAYDEMLKHFKKSDVLTLEGPEIVHYIRKIKISD